MKNNTLYLVVFNARLSDGCDYVTQTLPLLARTGTVVAIALGEAWGWKDIGKKRKKSKSPITIWKPFLIIPGQRFRYIKTLNVMINALALWFFLTLKSRSFINKYLWFFEPQFASPFLSLFKNYRKIYDCVDYFRAWGATVEKEESRLLKSADVILVNSQTLYSIHASKTRNIHVVPLGFAQELFANQKLSKRNNKKPPIKVGFIGGISYRLDYPLLYKLVETYPDYIFEFVGPIQFGFVQDQAGLDEMVRKLLSYPNVQWTKPLKKTKIPAKLNEFATCIIPYDIKYDFNKYCFPMKTMEYLYMEKPIIATSIEELKRLQPMIVVAQTHNKFIQAISDSINNLHSVSIRHKQRRIAIENSWSEKISKALSYV